MTAQRDFKRVVRTRMQKTGESYTAARAQVLRRRPTPPLSLSIKPAPRPEPARAPGKVDYVKLAGMSDAAIKKGTGCTWEAWVKTLDHVGAHGWPHWAIAEFVHDKYQVKAWWTQMLTVGYERIKGLRDVGQRRGGSYEANRSRTFNVGMTRLYNAFATPRGRAPWLAGVTLTVRTATRNRSMRITWEDGTSVEVWFISKGRSKSVVAVGHRKLDSKAAAEKMKRYWGERLDALAAVFDR